MDMRNKNKIIHLNLETIEYFFESLNERNSFLYNQFSMQEYLKEKV